MTGHDRPGRTRTRVASVMSETTTTKLVDLFSGENARTPICVKDCAASLLPADDGSQQRIARRHRLTEPPVLTLHVHVQPSHAVIVSHRCHRSTYLGLILPRVDGVQSSCQGLRPVRCRSNRLHRCRCRCRRSCTLTLARSPPTMTNRCHRCRRIRCRRWCRWWW